MNMTPSARRLAALKATAAKHVNGSTHWSAARYGAGAHHFGAPAAGWNATRTEFYPMSFAGFREVGSAYDVAKREGSRAVESSGWYVDAYQSETVTGHVLQMPARDGVARYVPALQWSDRDGVTIYIGETYAEALEAARAADGYAEKVSEEEREYSEAWSLGSDWATMGETIVTTRREALALLVERRAVTLPPQMCATIRSRVEGLLEAIRTTREERAELADRFTGGRPRTLADAFNEGAGETVIA